MLGLRCWWDLVAFRKDVSLPIIRLRLEGLFGMERVKGVGKIVFGSFLKGSMSFDRRDIYLVLRIFKKNISE